MLEQGVRYGMRRAVPACFLGMEDLLMVPLVSCCNSWRQNCAGLVGSLSQEFNTGVGSVRRKREKVRKQVIHYLGIQIVDKVQEVIFRTPGQGSAVEAS